MEENETVRWPFYARLSMVLTSVVLLLFLLHEGKSIIIPLFFSMLIAFMLLPVTKWLERRRLSRTLAAMLSILLFVVFIAGVVFFLGQQIADFSKELPLLGARIQGWTKDIQQWVSMKYKLDYTHQIEYINKAGAGMANYASIIAQAFFLALTGFVIWTIFVFIFTFFMLTHRALLKRFITSLFSTRYQSRVTEVMSETRLLANSYISGLMIEMVIVAVLNCIMFLIFGIKYAFLLGILAAVLNIIPYLGIYTAAAIAGIITLSNGSPSHALTAVLILLGVHFIDANILLPRIVGARVKMNPLITIVAVLMGSMLWGIPGMFLFIPLAAMLKIIFERVEGLKPWAILMGTDETEKKPVKEIPPTKPAA